MQEDIFMNDLKSLRAIFDGTLFRIPDYQRGYAWQEKQLTDFWTDLVNLPNSKSHYTGMLSLKRLTESEAKAVLEQDYWLVKRDCMPCYVVDGQQRLTTSIILISRLLCFIRDLPENKGKKDEEVDVTSSESLAEIKVKYICKEKSGNQIITYYFGYGSHYNNSSADYLRYRIFEEPSSGSIIENYYTRNLQYAKNFFDKNISCLYKNSGIIALAEIYEKLTHCFMFIIHEIDESYDECIAFETMNNRGKQLTNLELLKNRLIYLTTLFKTNENDYDEHDQNALRKAINTSWAEIYFQLGKNKKLLSDDEFLRAHWIFYYTYSRRKGNDYMSYLLKKFAPENVYEQVSVSPNEEAAETLFEYSPDDSEEEEIESYQKENTLGYHKLTPCDIREYVDSLKRAVPYWYWTYYPNDNGLDNPLSLEEKFWLDKLNRIGIGYFRPLVTVICMQTDSPVEKKVYALKSIERFIFILFRMGKNRSNYHDSQYHALARNLYHKEKGIDEVIEALNSDINNNIEYAITSFITYIQQRFKEGNGFFDWSSIYYFFYEYEAALQERAGINKIISWESFVKPGDNVTIEHILPQTPTNYYWRNMFRQYNEQEIRWLCSAIGNLLPLSQSVNSSLQNNAFIDKKYPQNKERRGYSDGSHSEIEVSRYEEWTGQAIYERSKQLLRFLSQRWKCPFTNDQLQTLAFVSFVEDGRSIPPEIES